MTENDRVTVVRCEVCNLTMRPNRALRVNGHVFCVASECIEKGMNRVLEPIGKAVKYIIQNI